MNVRIGILLFIVSACGQAKEKNSGAKPALPEAEETAQNEYKPNPDTVSYLLQASLDKDTFTHEDFYLRFYSGNLFSPKETHAAVLYKINDSADMLKVYRRGKHWEEIVAFEPDLTWINARLEFEDMNFDGQRDLKVIRFVSNGWSMAGMHLFLYAQGKKLHHIPQADTLHNLSCGHKEILTAESVAECEKGRNIAIHYYKWKGDKLVYVKTNSPCKQD